MRSKIHLTAEQLATFEKLKAGILAVAALSSSDHDAIETWLEGGLFRGPSRATLEDELVFQVAQELMKTVRSFDDRDGAESSWEEMIAASLEAQ